MNLVIVESICESVAPDNADHAFSNCALLRDHPHCRRIYITAMSALRRIIKEQKRHLSAAQRTATINELLASIDNAAQDFQKGTVKEPDIMNILLTLQTQVSELQAEAKERRGRASFISFILFL